MAEKEQINMRVDPDRKERWEQYVEENRVNGGMTGLIRTAVKNYIESDQSQSANPSSVAIPDDLTSELSEIKNTLNEVQFTVERTDESVGFLEQEIVGSDERPFSDRLIRAIPPARPHSEKWEQDRERLKDQREGEPIVWEGTLDAFAEQLDADRETIKASLEAMVNQQDPFIETGTVNELRRYWCKRDLERQPYADGRKLEEEVKRRKFRNRQEGRE